MEVAVNEFENKGLLTIKQMCQYLSIGDSTARKILSNPKYDFAFKIGNRLYANKKKLDRWIENNVEI